MSIVYDYEPLVAELAVKRMRVNEKDALKLCSIDEIKLRVDRLNEWRNKSAQDAKLCDEQFPHSSYPIITEDLQEERAKPVVLFTFDSAFHSKKRGRFFTEGEALKAMDSMEDEEDVYSACILVNGEPKTFTIK